MVFKARNLILLFLFMASCQESLLGMSKARRLLTSPIAKNIGAAGAATVAAGLTCTHYGIILKSSPLSINDIITPHSDEPMNQLEQVSPEVEEFVRKIISEYNPLSPEQLTRIKIRKYCLTGAYSTPKYDYILLNTNNEALLSQALNSSSDTITQELPKGNLGFSLKPKTKFKRKFILDNTAAEVQHELQHILNGDTTRTRFLINSGASIAGAECLGLFFRKHFKPHNYFIKREFDKLIS